MENNKLQFIEPNESYILILGKTLRECRKYCALSQEKVVKDICELGYYTTIRSLSNWENGYNMPTKCAIEVLDKYYHKKIKFMDKVLGWQE